jgi:aspartyl protease family protein
MSDRDGPWRRNPPARSGRDGARSIFRFVLLLLAGGLGLWMLAGLFPGRLASDDDRAYLGRALVVVALLASGLMFSRRIALATVVRNIAIWAGVAAVVILGFTFQDELRDAAFRVRAELFPGYPVVTDSKTLVLTESSDGHFHILGEANGTRVNFLIDTGASDIVLAPADARRLGIDVRALSFSRVYQTANGIGRGAPFTLESLTIGPVRRAHVAVSINQAEMRDSLLGMSFLQSLSSFEIRGRKLYLRWQ